MHAHMPTSTMHGATPAVVAKWESKRGWWVHIQTSTSYILVRLSGVLHCILWGKDYTLECLFSMPNFFPSSLNKFQTHEHLALSSPGQKIC